MLQNKLHYWNSHLQFIRKAVSLYASASYAAVTNYHKFAGLRQHRFILLWFWRPEDQNQFQWDKVKVSAWLVPSGSPREKFIYLSSVAFGGHLHFWIVTPSSNYSNLLLPSLHLLLLFCKHISLIRTLVITFKAHQENLE